ncbi:Hypothetical protein MVR_LOCUS75 [uncultured virus]|nr:Hypothetical protein MVR_LOCUS75 [uncultured virus]
MEFLALSVPITLGYLCCKSIANENSRMTAFMNQLDNSNPNSNGLVMLQGKINEPICLIHEMAMKKLKIVTDGTCADLVASCIPQYTLRSRYYKIMRHQDYHMNPSLQYMSKQIQVPMLVRDAMGSFQLDVNLNLDASVEWLKVEDVKPHDSSSYQVQHRYSNPLLSCVLGHKHGNTIDATAVGSLTYVRHQAYVQNHNIGKVFLCATGAVVSGVLGLGALACVLERYA